MTVRTRFAPSPTGYLHIGGLRTALYAYLFAKKNDGVFILRIEDTDQARFVEGAVEKIYSGLRLAGLEWDEGPDKGGNYGPYVQSERKDMYLPYAKELVEKGKAYYCFCTKEDLDEPVPPMMPMVSPDLICKSISARAIRSASPQKSWSGCCWPPGWENRIYQ